MHAVMGADRNAGECLRVVDHNRGTVLADRAVRARSFLARLRGLMGAATLPPGVGLLLDGDNAIHTCFMRFPIDVVFLDDQARVLHLIHRLSPWRVSRIVWRARAVLELPSGTLARTGTRVGDRLAFEAIPQ
jgi:uncharacterized membrane protein (UPF0127 family)